VRVLLWHVHGSWTTGFVQGAHEYIVPVVPDRGPDGRGRAQTWQWPASVVELGPGALQDAAPDVVILQRRRDEELLERWTGLRAGRDVPAIWLEHNAPQGRISEMRHPAADRDDVVVCHVTHFNDLFWECGTTRTQVIKHGIVDPGYRYRGELPRAAAVINEAGRRARVTGTDLLERFAGSAPVDLFGMDAARLGGIENLPQERLHDELGRRRVYLHPIRWTSLGLSLLESMHLGMPVVALATTEAPEAVPEEAGVVSTRVDVLRDAVAAYIAEPDRAREAGLAARRHALEHYGLKRFLARWNELLEDVVA